MEIKKFENTETPKWLDASLKSKIFAKRITKKFFSELVEFDRVIVVKDTDPPYNFQFSICFESLYKESLDQIENFSSFMGFTKDSWFFRADNFTYDDNPKIFFEFHLNEDGVSKYLEKIQMEDDAEKYNL